MTGQPPIEELYRAACLARDAVDPQRLELHARALVAEAQRLGSKRLVAHGNAFLGLALILRGEAICAHVALAEALEMAVTARDAGAEAAVAATLATLALHVDGNVEAAQQWSERCLALDGADKFDTGMALGNLADICRQEGDYRRSIEYANRAIVIFRELDDFSRVSWQLSTVAHVYLLKRDDEAFARTMRDTFDAANHDRLPRFVARYFDLCFIALARYGRWEDAARVLGFLEQYRDEKRQVRLNGLMPWYSEPMERLSKSLSDERLAELIREGGRLTLEQVQDVVTRVFDEIVHRKAG